MRSGCGTPVIVVWLLIGALAAGQRGYYSGTEFSCTRLGTTLLTLAAGPLNYVGVNPMVTCRVPQPSR